jgi:hypothetical protein
LPFVVVVDNDAQPGDYDAALIDFLVKFIERRAAEPPKHRDAQEPGGGRSR